jgi:hypothetical protein
LVKEFVRGIELCRQTPFSEPKWAVTKCSISLHSLQICNDGNDWNEAGLKLRPSRTYCRYSSNMHPQSDLLRPMELSVRRSHGTSLFHIVTPNLWYWSGRKQATTQLDSRIVQMVIVCLRTILSSGGVGRIVVLPVDIHEASLVRRCKYVCQPG